MQQLVVIGLFMSKRAGKVMQEFQNLIEFAKSLQNIRYDNPENFSLMLYELGKIFLLS